MDFPALDSFVWTAAAVAILPSVLYLYAKYKLSYWARRGVPSLPAHVVFGNMRDLILLRRGPGEMLQRLYNSVDPEVPFVGVYLFHKPLLIVRSIELLRQMIIRDFDAFENRGFGGFLETDPVGYVNLLTIKAPRWKYLRAKIAASLTGPKLRNLFPLLLECGDNLMAHIDAEMSRSEEPKIFELKGMAGIYSTDVIASTAFGIATNSFENDTDIYYAGQRTIVDPKRGIILLINFFFPELTRLTALISRGPGKIFRRIFWDSYEARVRSGEKRGDLMDHLIALKNGEQNPNFIFDGDNLVSQAVSFFEAGYDAVASVVAFTLHELSFRPELEAQAYEEIMACAGTDELTMDQLNEMTFLEKCLQESTRLHPPLPMNDRIAARDYKIPGTNVTLEKGTKVFIATMGTNMDPTIFKDPEKYDPLRTDGEKLGWSATHMSFGIGPRACIGQRFGMLICKVALVRILKKYTIHKTATVEHGGGSIFTTTASGIPLRLQRRA